VLIPAGYVTTVYDPVYQLAPDGMPVGLAANEMDRADNTLRSHAKRVGLRFERDRLSRIRHRQT